jgi:hypothetical protein
MKNWLIRTNTNHILGPVSKNKIKELIENGSISEHDEITSGNGYWFFVREKSLLDKFVYGEDKQEFNPVSDALLEKRIREKEAPQEGIDYQTQVINLKDLVNSQAEITQVETFVTHNKSEDDLEKKKSEEIKRSTYYQSVSPPVTEDFRDMTDAEVDNVSFILKKNFYKVLLVLAVMLGISLLSFKNQIFNLLMDVASGQEQQSSLVKKKVISPLS